VLIVVHKVVVSTAIDSRAVGLEQQSDQAVATAEQEKEPAALVVAVDTGYMIVIVDSGAHIVAVFEVEEEFGGKSAKETVMV